MLTQRVPSLSAFPLPSWGARQPCSPLPGWFRLSLRGDNSTNTPGEDVPGSYPDEDGEEEVSAELLHPLGGHLAVVAVVCLPLQGIFLQLDGGAGT